MTTAIRITFDKLAETDSKGAEALSDALCAAQNGCEVTIAVTYAKQTKSPARIPGKDCRALLGTTPETIIGTVVKVAVGKNGPYFLLTSPLTRGPVEGEGPGWTALKPAGVLAAQVLAVAK